MTKQTLNDFIMIDLMNLFLLKSLDLNFFYLKQFKFLLFKTVGLKFS